MQTAYIQVGRHAVDGGGKVLEFVACKTLLAAARSDGGIDPLPVRHLKKVPAS